MISIIAAMAKNRVIGNKNKIPWHIPADLIRTKKITMGHPIIMGQATHESISRFRSGGKWVKGKIQHRILSGRTNIVLSFEKKYIVPGGIVANSIDDAINEAKKSPGSGEIFFLGGASVYKQIIDITDKIYLTIVDYEPEGDVFFPEFSDKNWDVISKEPHKRDSESNFDYEYITYVRKPSD
ncbi:dihydrofolate reductase [Candidatus Dojkabacteria bacterium]|nr:dihydrofolate reductase [Candidatus Dojkabacteria bacterium]